MAALALGVAPAAADTYYTTPSPGGGADCSQASPCSLLKALHESPLQDGDGADALYGDGGRDTLRGGGDVKRQ